ncbi:DinB family protein [Nocardia sp. NPDC056100]|uniref:DinB family protein n=1 Tax=Nocardia sp. NPDC056100 TaxID=3345712 RepID=UPI0035E3018C
MDTSRSAVLRSQFDVVWSLLDYHLERLAVDDFLWAPVQLSWTLRHDYLGHWVPDWEDSEPDPIPVPTIGWITWHIGWWWTVTIDHVRHHIPRDRDAILWPGPSAAVADWLRELRSQWLEILDDLTDSDLEAPIGFPWPIDSGKVRYRRDRVGQHRADEKRRRNRAAAPPARCWKTRVRNLAMGQTSRRRTSARRITHPAIECRDAPRPHRL